MACQTESKMIAKASGVEVPCGTIQWQSSNRKHAYFMINNLSFLLIAVLGCLHGESWHLPPHSHPDIVRQGEN